MGIYVSAIGLRPATRSPDQQLPAVVRRSEGLLILKPKSVIGARPSHSKQSPAVLKNGAYGRPIDSAS